LNETYFDHLPGYNDRTKEGYHDYRILIPSAKFAIPYSNGDLAGKAFYTIGYSQNISLTMLVPNYMGNIEFRQIETDAIQDFRDAASDSENYDGLMNDQWETLPIINYTIDIANASASGFYNVTLGPFIEQFPIHNNVTPDTATYNVLMKMSASQIAHGTNIVMSNPLVRSHSYGYIKYGNISTPNYRTVKSRGAWISATYSTKVVTD